MRRSVLRFLDTLVMLYIVCAAAAFIIFFVGSAFAHPVDLPCPPGKGSDDGCTPQVAALGLDNPDFFNAVRGYWHCRRLLVADDIVGIAQCVGGKKNLNALLRRTDTTGIQETALMTYWNVVPARPEFDLIGTQPIEESIERTNNQTAACDLTRFFASVALSQCEQERAKLYAAARRRVR